MTEIVEYNYIVPTEWFGKNIQINLKQTIVFENKGIRIITSVEKDIASVETLFISLLTIHDLECPLSIEEIPLDIMETLLDDLNTPGFIAKIHELYTKANKGDLKSKRHFNSACKLIGLFDLSKNEWENLKKNNKDISEDFILKKIEERSAAKQKGDYKLADQIRDELLNKDVIIEDQKGKTIWKFK